MRGAVVAPAMREKRSDTVEPLEPSKELCTRWLRIQVVFATCVGLCAMMVVWVLWAPGSCVPWRSAAFSKSARRVVPATLITKYAKNQAACVFHVLPSVVWSVLAPVQLSRLFRVFPSRKGRTTTTTKTHRLAGVVFFAVVLSMAYGYFTVIHKRGLHFHQHDFPGVPKDEALSFVMPRFWPELAGLGGKMAEACVWATSHVSTRTAGQTWGGANAFMTFEHACIVWFLATACVAVSIPIRFAKRKESRGSLGVEPAPSRRAWVRAHRAWAIRHVASGCSDAAQRLFLFLAHGVCHAYSGTAFCASPATQKGIFADALVLGTAICVFVAEVVIRDANALEDELGKRRSE